MAVGRKAMTAEPRVGPVVPFFDVVEWSPGGRKMAVLVCPRSECKKMFAFAWDDAISYRGTTHPCPHCMRVSCVRGDLGMDEEEIERFKADHGDGAALARLPKLRT